MNILMIAGYYPKPHNRVMGIWAHEQARVLKRRGNKVVVISPTPWLPKVINTKKVSTKIRNWISVPVHEVYEGVDIYNLRVPIWPQVRVLNKIYNNLPNIKEWLAYLSMSKQLKRIIQDEEIDIIHAHGPSYEGMLACSISRKYNIPFCVTENSAWDPLFAVKNKSLKKAYQRVFDEASCIIPVSQLIKEHVLKFGEKYREKVRIVHPGVDVDKVSKIKANKPEQYSNNQVILSVGALEERKGHAYLVDAIAKIYESYPMLKCLIIGSDSTEGKNLELKVKQYGLEDVVDIIGQMSHTEVLGYMSWCDMFVLPSWYEAFGVVYAEAMAQGKPIIGVEGEGISDVIEGEVNGILVPQKDSVTLSKEISNLLNNKTLRNTIGRNGKKTVENLLTWEYNALKMEEIYQSVY